jgi:predicted GTPase
MSGAASSDTAERAGSPFEAHKARREQVIAELSATAELASEVGTASLRERIEEQLVTKLRDNRFFLVVVGEFNHGKSSLVNALLGQAVLNVGVTPTTAAIHQLCHGDDRTASVVRDDGSETPIAFESLSDYDADAEADSPPDAGPDSATDAGPDSATDAETDSGSDAETGAPAAIRHIVVSHPSELLREGITLIDTPGVNDLCLQRADITYEYIPQSDAVLFVLDAGQPLKESERIFLKDKLLAKSRDKIIFVVCKADIWNDDERVEAMQYIRSELDKLVDSPTVFAVSAQQALTGDRAASGVPELLRHLTTFLAEERGRIALDNALGEALGVCQTLSHALNARRRAAQMSGEEIEHRIATIEDDLAGHRDTLGERRAAIREEVAAIKAWLRRDLERFADDVVRQLPAAVDDASADELRRHWVGFLEATFAGWASEQSSEVAAALEKLADKTVALMREDAHDAAARLSAGAGGDMPPPDVQIDTFAYDLSVAALFSVGMGMVFSNFLLGILMTGAAPALAYYLKGKIELETRAKAQEQAALAIRQAVHTVSPKLEAMIDEFATRLDRWVVETGRALHRELLDVLRSSQDAQREGGVDAAELTARCDRTAVELATQRERFERIRGELWGA